MGREGAKSGCEKLKKICQEHERSCWKYSAVKEQLKGGLKKNWKLLFWGWFLDYPLGKLDPFWCYVCSLSLRVIRNLSKLAASKICIFCPNRASSESREPYECWSGQGTERERLESWGPGSREGWSVSPPELWAQSNFTRVLVAWFPICAVQA